MVMFVVAICWGGAVLAVLRTRIGIRIHEFLYDVSLIAIYASLLALVTTTVLTLFTQWGNTLGAYVMAQFGLVAGMLALLLIAAGALRSSENRPVQ